MGTAQSEAPPISLPKRWTGHVKSAVLHVISLAQFSIMSARAEVISDKNANPFQVRIERLEHEMALCRDQIRITDQRMGHRNASAVCRSDQPHAARSSRISNRSTDDRIVHELGKFVHGLAKLQQGVGSFFICPPHPRRDGCRGNKRFKTLCPTMGKKKIAEILCRAGLHLSTTTVARMLKDKPAPTVDDAEPTTDPGQQ